MCNNRLAEPPQPRPPTMNEETVHTWAHVHTLQRACTQMCLLMSKRLFHTHLHMQGDQQQLIECMPHSPQKCTWTRACAPVQRCRKFLLWIFFKIRDDVKLTLLVRARDCLFRGRRFDSGKNSEKKNSFLHGFEQHRPSSKGAKWLFRVINAIMINIANCLESCANIVQAFACRTPCCCLDKIGRPTLLAQENRPNPR